MTKYLAIIFIALLSAALWINYKTSVPWVYTEIYAPQSVHAYNNPEQLLNNIHVRFVYFVPKNKTPVDGGTWRELADSELRKLIAFHELQFHELSNITYEIYPSAVIGLEDNIYYDTAFTNDGNPEALKNISNEIAMRMSTDGDLSLIKPKEGAYNVTYILYEGVGASAGGNVALISRKFLTMPEYELVSSSLFAHEFYHTLGLADDYQKQTDISTSEDIMGLGRFRDINRVFIDPLKLKQFGL